MDSSRFKGIPNLDALSSGARERSVNHCSRRHSSPKSGLSSPPLEFQGLSRFHQNRSFTHYRLRTSDTLARAKSNKSDCTGVGAPLELWTPEGKFLCSVLKDQPLIFQAAAAKQLDELAFARDSAFARLELSEGSSESCLHRRISEIKDRECQLAVEEIIYMLVVHNFSEIKVPMIPNLSACISNGQLDIWSSKDRELESIHGTEILEMVRENISNILRLHGKSASLGDWATIRMDRLRLGRLYAASIMFGYFLKSISQRHSLELRLSSSREEHPRHRIMCPSHQHFEEREDQAASGCSTARRDGAEKLRGYMLRFDSTALRLCSKLRSHEAKNLVENHSWALFENPESGSLDVDEVVDILVSGLRRLVLEAVAFGTFLWEVEWYVDFRYGLKSK
ncbi:hypothetical protein KSP40_PGU010504 [Platanthera guangdongensis]|uniref:Uncharacterized protein n=1 Tax=Platanthera guangdongensis TaxID=2320717 RepID=A0ABR2M6D3_9ASPA